MKLDEGHRTRDWNEQEARRQVRLERVFLVAIVAAGVFLLVADVLLPLLHIADFLNHDMRLHVLLKPPSGHATDLAQGDGARIVQSDDAVLVLDGTRFDPVQRLLYWIPTMVGALLVTAVLWQLRRLLRLARSGPFGRVDVFRTLLGTGVLIALLGKAVPLVTSWCVSTLTDRAGVSATAVTDSPLPYYLGFTLALGVVLAAGRDAMRRAGVAPPDGRTPEAPPPLHVSEVQETQEGATAPEPERDGRRP
ncbi:hypothetical protein OG426_10480 [Streptomyces canus]|uniref:hypothetical protein n=1 Tax=Streptomyces canus TaxID=58343 RepID=UPI0038657BCD|nr:hypothetical protein OG426_10480 [Streptomyces canus]